MRAFRIPFLQIIITLAIFCRSFGLNAQQVLIDTSLYIPSFYPGAVNYNLMIAASNGYSSEIQRLISKGADVNAENDEGATPLIFAVTNNITDAVKALLKFKSDPNKVTSNFDSPLKIAVRNRNFEITEALIRAGAQVDNTDLYGATPLNHAAVSGYIEIVDLLLYYSASIDEKTTGGTTPLLSAIWAGYSDVADLLIKNGANLEARDNDGVTPFMMASLSGDTLIMRLLYKNGVDIYAINNARHNALNLAIYAGQKEAITLLLQIGKNWGSSAKTAISPYSVATKYHRTAIIDSLRAHNIPGQIKNKVDQVAISALTKFSMHDMYTGISFAFKEPFLNGGIIAGADMKLWYTRVLIQESEHLFYQYMNKDYIVYAGIFKDFSLTNRPDKINFAMSVSLLGGYNFGNKFKGTQITPENKFLLLPSLSFKMTKRNFSAFLGMEYQKTDYYKVGPLWFRAGLSYNYFFDNVRIRLKPINWY